MERLLSVLGCIFVIILTFFFIAGCTVGVSVRIDPSEIRDVFTKKKKDVSVEPEEKKEETTKPVRNFNKDPG